MQSLPYSLLTKLPALPQDLVEHIVESISDVQTLQKVPLKTIQLDGTDVEDAIYTRSNLDKVYTNWILENIPELKYQSAVIGFQSIKNTSGTEFSQLHPHTDGVARGAFCISYLINTGGDNVETTWWQEVGRDLQRAPWSHCWDLNKLTEVSKTIYPNNSWNIMRTDWMHSVQYINSDRIALTIGFSDEELFFKIMETYK
jgi:hypothetical protein